MEAVDEGLLREPEIVQITVAKARKLGRHHMMTGQNPIYIISEEKCEHSKNFNCCTVQWKWENGDFVWADGSILQTAKKCCFL